MERGRKKKRGREEVRGMVYRKLNARNRRNRKKERRGSTYIWK